MKESITFLSREESSAAGRKKSPFEAFFSKLVPGKQKKQPRKLRSTMNHFQGK